jgi:hypothetical protein
LKLAPAGGERFATPPAALLVDPIGAFDQKHHRRDKSPQSLWVYNKATYMPQMREAVVQ